jgi:hypothetical protein
MQKKIKKFPAEAAAALPPAWTLEPCELVRHFFESFVISKAVAGHRERRRVDPCATRGRDDPRRPRPLHVQLSANGEFPLCAVDKQMDIHRTVCAEGLFLKPSYFLSNFPAIYTQLLSQRFVST